MKLNRSYKLLVASLTMLFISACNSPVQAPAPSPIPATPTPVVFLSQRLTLASLPYTETHQDPLFRITSQIPQLSGSDDPRVTVFNQILDKLVRKEMKSFSDEFLLYSATPIPTGSSLEGTYTLTAQYDDIWSFKFDFLFYYDNPARPGLYSIPINYDLAQGKELVLNDLFLPHSNYLEAISNYCVAELSKRNTTDDSIYGATYPIPYNYQDNWNIMPEGLMITFNQTEVAPHEAGPQSVIVPYSELKDVIDSQGPLRNINSNS